MNKIELLSFWVETLRVPKDKYEIKLNETDDEIFFKVFVEKSYMGKLLGISGVIYITLKRLMYSSLYKTQKRIEIEILAK